MRVGVFDEAIAECLAPEAHAFHALGFSEGLAQCANKRIIGTEDADGRSFFQSEAGGIERVVEEPIAARGARSVELTRRQN